MLDVVTHIQRKLDPTLVLPLRVPRRHVRLVRDDGQRQGALDVPHARRQGRRGRPPRDRAAQQPAGGEGSRHRHGAVLRQVGAGERAVSRRARRARTTSRACRPDRAERKLVDEAIECIGCGVCYSSCDVVTWNPDYLGPAALNRAWTLRNDVRDAGAARAPRGGRGRRGLPRLPHADELHRALPEAALADAEHRGAEARGAQGARSKASCESAPRRSMPVRHSPACARRSCCGPRSARRRPSSRVCVRRSSRHDRSTRCATA